MGSSGIVIPKRIQMNANEQTEHVVASLGHITAQIGHAFSSELDSSELSCPVM